MSGGSRMSLGKCPDVWQPPSCVGTAGVMGTQLQPMYEECGQSQALLPVHLNVSPVTGSLQTLRVWTEVWRQRG